MSDLSATSLTGKEVILAAARLEEFRARLRGEVLTANNASYEEVRQVWNGLIDKRPSLIVRCTGAADVIEAVSFASDHQLLTAVRGGGHNVAGHAACEGGLMIDLSLMRGIRVDAKARTVRAQGGVTWGELDRETQVFGLATPGGVVSTTGIAGLTLGGGIGFLRRKYGMSCDNLVSVDIVTADGQLRTASTEENPDLYWALRGGGGNFGVVTSFEFQLHPVGPMVMLAAVMYPPQNGPQLLQKWHAFMAKAPDEVSSQAGYWTTPNIPDIPEALRGRPTVFMAALYAGDATEGERMLQPLREFDTPLLDLSAIQPYTAVQSGMDFAFPKGALQYYWKSIYLNRLNEEILQIISRRAANRPSPLTLINLWHMGGAMSRVPVSETAYAVRNTSYLLEISSTWEDPQASEQNIEWTRSFWREMTAYSGGQSYLNFPGLGEEGDRLVKTAYGPNYDRLREIKARYDPSNLFQLNQNINPSS